jgi:hypothetical protein
LERKQISVEDNNENNSRYRPAQKAGVPRKKNAPARNSKGTIGERSAAGFRTNFFA